MNETKENRINNIIGGIIFFTSLVGMTALGYSYALVSRPEKAMHDLIVFIVIFFLLLAFAVVAGWQINGKIPFRKGVALRRLVAINKRNGIVGNLIKIAFHLFPLYFTLVLIKMDLFVGFKAGLVILALFSYMLIELDYIFKRTIALTKYFNIKSRFGIAAMVICVPIVLFISIFYFVYGLIQFYIIRFPI